jgi:hypothetical protein
MATVRDHGAAIPVGRGRPREARPSHRLITLYDLITALQDVVGPADDGLVVAIVRHLLGARRLTVLGAETRRCSSHSITGKEVKAVEGVVLGAGLVAVLVGVGALVEAAPGKEGRAAAGPSLAPG